MKSKKIDKLDKTSEQIELGKKLQAFYESGYVNKKQALVFSLLKGIATGVGVFIGGTVVIAFLLWGLSFFNEVPLLGEFSQKFQHTLQK